jgi:group I intron endonuclease
MKLNKEDKNKCGIYCIYNIINQKKYIGKSKNIYRRLRQHIYQLRKKLKDENRFLINAWHKYGEENFEYFVIEELSVDEKLLKWQELYWITTYNTTNAQFGYNLRLDSSTNMVVHERTRKLISDNNKGVKNPNYNHKWNLQQKQRMSEIKKQQYAEGVVKPNLDATYKGIHQRNLKWKQNPELKEQMKERIRKAITKYQILQYTKDGTFVKTWNNVHEIILENPTYKSHNIYAVCSGEKKTMYGFIWKKQLNNDIVQTDLKESE